MSLKISPEETQFQSLAKRDREGCLPRFVQRKDNEFWEVISFGRNVFFGDDALIMFNFVNPRGSCHVYIPASEFFGNWREPAKFRAVVKKYMNMLRGEIDRSFYERTFGYVGF